MTWGRVTGTVEGDSMLLETKGQKLRLSRVQLSKLKSEALEIGINADMIKDDNEINYSLDLPRQLHVSLTELDEKLKFQKYTFSPTGERITRRMVKIDLWYIEDFLNFIEKF